jgi:hypothetical protein
MGFITFYTMSVLISKDRKLLRRTRNKNPSLSVELLTHVGSQDEMLKKKSTILVLSNLLSIFFSNLILFYVSLSCFILHRWNCSMLPHKALPALLIFCSYLAHPATMDRTHRSWGLSLDTISQWPFSIIECCEFLQSVLQKLHFSATGNRRSISTYGLEPTKKQSGCVCRQAE